jgi:uncharacterized protein YfaA (DUF2138 family)
VGPTRVRAGEGEGEALISTTTLPIERPPSKCSTALQTLLMPVKRCASKRTAYSLKPKAKRPAARLWRPIGANDAETGLPLS